MSSKYPSINTFSSPWSFSTNLNIPNFSFLILYSISSTTYGGGFLCPPSQFSIVLLGILKYFANFLWDIPIFSLNFLISIISTFLDSPHTAKFGMRADAPRVYFFMQPEDILVVGVDFKITNQPADISLSFYFLDYPGVENLLTSINSTFLIFAFLLIWRLIANFYLWNYSVNSNLFHSSYLLSLFNSCIDIE